eukprot:TRINITY_DN2257_c0_g1_i5.p1 TRINITY_DN2257_c0_g1~~TRINITY_DN2257_c0_g1_i5.p1  ORF type:complete len:214 (-),score=73.61 TRINITY_DN2257_c0_g1_i5:53-694(-)
MKILTILGFALAVILVNGGRFDECKYFFEEISRHPFFSQKPGISREDKPLQNLRENLFSFYHRLWDQKCKNEINILVNTNKEAAQILYKTNNALSLHIREGRMYWWMFDDLRVSFTGFWVRYVDGFRKAVIAAYKNSNNQNCRKQLEELAQVFPEPKEMKQAFDIGWRTFDTFDYCESNRGRLLLIEKLMKSCLLYTSPSPRDRQKSRMPSSA